MSDATFPTLASRIMSLWPRGETKKEFLKRIGLTPANISYWDSGQHSPTIKKVETIARRLNKNPGWLAFGIGDPSPDPPLN